MSIKQTQNLPQKRSFYKNFGVLFLRIHLAPSKFQLELQDSGKMHNTNHNRQKINCHVAVIVSMTISI